MISRHGWVRNPLSVIAIFAGVAEVCGTLVLPKLTGHAQITFMQFVMFFPCALVGLFFFVLWFKAKVLYAPGDYQNDQSFKEMHGVYSKDGENATQPARNQDLASSVESAAPDSTDVEQPSACTTEDPAEEDSRNSNSVREPKAPYGDPEPAPADRPEAISPFHGSIANYIVNSDVESFERYTAEKRALSELHKIYGGTVTEPAIMSPAGAAPYMIDGYITSGNRQYFVEVIYITKTLSRHKAHTAASRLAAAWQAVPEESRHRTTCIICVVAKEQTLLETSIRPLRSMLSREYPNVNFKVESINTSMLR